MGGNAREATRRLLGLTALVLALLCGGIGVRPSAAGATTPSHVLLRSDRTGTAVASVTWDARQGVLRQRRGSTAGRYFTGSVVRDAPAVVLDQCGSSVATGDVNGDRLEDLVLGCPGANGGAGKAIVITRAAGDTSWDAAVSIDSAAQVATAACGTSVATGDVNDDGHDDVIVGCPGDGAATAGALYVYVRDAANSGFDAGEQLVSATASARCGNAAGAGDVNGDGRDDVVGGCSNRLGGGVGRGGVVVYERSVTNDGFDAAAEFGDSSPADNDACATSMLVADLDDDGRSDIAMGCPGDDAAGADAGNAVVLLRNTTNSGFNASSLAVPAMSATCGGTLSGGDINADRGLDLVLGCASTIVVFTRNTSNTGYDAPQALLFDGSCADSIAVGDVTGDSLADIAFGCASSNGASTGAGDAAVFARLDDDSGWDAASSNIHPDSVSVNAACGTALIVDDLDHDGVGELVLGCPGESSGAGGGAVAGAAVDPSTLVHDLPGATDTCGSSTAIGDVNGDGLDDIVMGCPLANAPAVDAGSAVVFVRSAAHGFQYGGALQDPAPLANARCGTSVAIGDVNDDGLDDVVIGCPERTVGGFASAGRLLVVTRNATNTGFDAAAVVQPPSSAANTRCGAAVAVGDTNADGRTDVMFGCPGRGTGGGAFVALRTSTNDGFDSALALVETAGTLVADSACGAAIAAGDVNDDGRDDVVIGCPNDDASAAWSGSALVFIRDAANTDFDTSVQLAHPSADAVDLCGTSVAVGDVNGDGRDDVVLGCPGDEASASDVGSAVVATRNAANTGWDAGVVLTDATAVGGEECGQSVSVGDVDGDRTDDVMVGCFIASGGDGSVHTYVRNAANTGFRTRVVALVGSNGSECGISLAAGDFTGDGRSDVAAGCDLDDTAASQAGSVRTAISTAGGAAGPAGTRTAGETLSDTGAAANGWCGTSTATGDVNGDGLDDVLVGCPGSNGSSDGQALLYVRAATNDGYEAAASFTSPSPGELASCGFAVALGDVNGDGRDDLLVACPYHDVGVMNSGGVLVFTRNAANSGFNSAAWVESPTPQTTELCGWSVTALDANGDGRDDVAMGCPYNDYVQSNAGYALVALRDATNTDFEPGVAIGEAVPDDTTNCGQALDGGDINGDGLDDVVLGCPHHDVMPNAEAGILLVAMRRAGNDGFDASVTLTPDSDWSSAHCGTAVLVADFSGDGLDDVGGGCNSSGGGMRMFERSADNTGFESDVMVMQPTGPPLGCHSSLAAGDVTGDGLIDVVLGCSTDSSGASSAGTAYVVPRSSDNSGFDAGTELWPSSIAANDHCGGEDGGTPTAVSAGDVNGDGRSDVVLGCSRHDGIAADNGSVTVFDDRSTMLETSTLNLDGATMTELTVSSEQRMNGAAEPALEGTVEGTSAWAPLDSGTPHTFAVSGADVRLRLTLPASRHARLTPVIHGLTLNLVTAGGGNAAPTAPTLATPANGATTTNPTPDFHASFEDPNAADLGAVEFELCTTAMPAATGCVAAGGSVVDSGTSGSGLSVGADGAWSPAALGAQTLYWHARGNDGTVVGPWSASRTLTISADSLTLTVDSATATIPPVALDGSATAETTLTISTDHASGYTVAATDESDVDGAACACGDTIPDWTGTDATPTAWPLATTGYFGITVLDATGSSDDRLAKWGTPNSSGWAASNVTDNFFAGLKLGSTVALHASSSVAASDTVAVAYRLAPNSSTQSGTYTSQITYTAIANP